MADVWIDFPKGFTVRDLGYIYGLLREMMPDSDEEPYGWYSDGMELLDIYPMVAQVFIDAMDGHDWDVRPTLTVRGVEGREKRVYR